MDDAALVVRRHKLDVTAYYRMAETGILGGYDRVELIDGEIIDMAPIGEDHASTVNVLTRLLVLACGDRALVSVQNPVRLDAHNEPQPDFAVLRPRADNYRDAHPSPADVLLLVEVADSSLRFDKAVKLPLYAAANIPEVWIVDMRRRALDAYRRPVESEYADRTPYAQDDRIGLALDPEISVTLSRVFS